MRVNKIGTLLAAAIVLMAIAGCASKPKPEVSAQKVRQEAENRAKPIETIPEVMPGWVIKVPDTPTTLSFVGSAGRYATATGNQGARYYAEDNGRSALVSWLGTLMVDKARTHAAIAGITSEIFSPQVIGQSLLERLSQNISSTLTSREYYTEIYLDNTNRPCYEVYVLMEIEKSYVKRVLDNYGKEQAENFAKKAAEEQDAVRKQQLEKAAEFFGGNLSSTLGF